MNESNVNIHKIRKISSIALILVTIAKIVLIIGTFVMFLTGCSMVWMSDTFDKKFAEAREMAEAKGFTYQEISTAIHIEGGLVSGIIDLKRNTESKAAGLGENLLAVAVIMATFAVVLHFAAKVFKALKESDSPFRPAVIKNIKIVLVLITIHLSLQSGLLVGVIVVFSVGVICLIFEYGCELQKQFDETL